MFNEINSDSEMNDTIGVFQAYHAATIFLDSVWERYKDNFSVNDFDEFSQFCGYLDSDPASKPDWTECYLKRTGKEIVSYEEKISMRTDEDLITVDEAFKIMQDLCVWHYKEFGFEFPQLIELLDSMIKTPHLHQQEQELWHHAIQRARSDEIMGAC